MNLPGSCFQTDHHGYWRSCGAALGKVIVLVAALQEAEATGERMKHAGNEALNTLEDLLKEIRKLDALRERRRGAFYMKSAGFLHFHEDPAGLFADLKVADKFERFPVNTDAERKQLIAKASGLVRVLAPQA